MAAPAHTVRTPPTGYLLKEGYKSTFAFNLAPSVQLWERDLKPPGIDGGGGIDITTQFNLTWHTMFPKHLKKLSPFNFAAGWDPDVYQTLIATVLNNNGSQTFWYPDGSSIDFFGWLDKFDPGEFKIGDFPIASCSNIPSNWDSVAGVEAGPVFNAAAGT